MKMFWSNAPKWVESRGHRGGALAPDGLAGGRRRWRWRSRPPSPGRSPGTGSGGARSGGRPRGGRARRRRPRGSRCWCRRRRRPAAAARASTPGSRSPRAAAEVTAVRQPVRSTASLSMSISGTVPHRAAISFFSRRRLRGSGAASSGVSLIAPSRALGDLQPVQAGQRVVQGVELGAHLLAQLGDERRRVQRLAQAGVVLGAARLEVGGQVLVGVAPPVGADDPDLLAAQLLAQRLEGDDLVDHPDHPLAAVLVGAVDQRLQSPVIPACDRDVLPGGVVGQAARGGVAADQRQGLDHRLAGAVAGAELQHLQQLDQPAPVVVGVGGPQRGLHGAPVGRAGGLVLGTRSRSVSLRPPPGRPPRGPCRPGGRARPRRAGTACSPSRRPCGTR